MVNRSAVIALLLLLSGVGSYLFATWPSYPNIPVDSIYSSVGPLEEAGAILVRNFTFTVYVALNTIKITGDISFASQSSTHYLDFYLPYVIYHYTNNTGGDLHLYTGVHPDGVDGKSSLIHAEIQGGGQGWHGFQFSIQTNQVIAFSQLGEDRVILTFAGSEIAGSSYRLLSLNKYRWMQSVDMLQLTPLNVVAVTDENHFFSSNCYPSPEAEYITTVWRIAKWRMDFSGHPPDYYRSIDCTIIDPRYVQARQTLIFVAGSVFSLGVATLMRPHRKDIVQSQSISYPPPIV